MRKLKVLVACEESQAVCKEFRALGHEAYSCDLLPCSGGHPEWHFQQDVTELLRQKWDLVIAFPPCTDLAVSGARHFERKKTDGSQQRSIAFFMLFAGHYHIKNMVIENPVGIMSSIHRKPDQIVQPWQFGDKAQKSTCLWLRGVPKLIHTQIVEKGEFWEHTRENGKKIKMPMWYYKALQDAKSPEHRRTLRSKTFPGIAKAMAAQWSEHILWEEFV